MVGKLRLAAITIVRDEATILEPFLRHNIRFFDRMFVVDDGSRDMTLEIMALLKQEGLDIQLIGQASSGSYYQGPKMKAALARVLTDGQWDAIVPLDADEFIVADSREAFEQDVVGIPEGSVGGLSPIHYAPSARDNPKIENPLVRIQHGYDTWPRAYKVVVPGSLAKADNASFAEGNHSFHVQGSSAPVQMLQSTRLIHFRARSTDELVAKSLIHYIRWCSRDDYVDGLVFHRINVVRAISENSSLTISDELAGQLASRFLIRVETEDLVCMPFDASHAVTRYTHLATMKPYRMIVTAIDDLIEELRVVREELAHAQTLLTVSNSELAELKGSTKKSMTTASTLIWIRLRSFITKGWRQWTGHCVR